MSDVVHRNDSCAAFPSEHLFCFGKMQENIGGELTSCAAVQVSQHVFCCRKCRKLILAN